MNEWHAEEVKKDYLSPEVPELEYSATCWTSLLSEPQQLHSFICSQVQVSLAVAPQVLKRMCSLCLVLCMTSDLTGQCCF